MGRLFNKKKKVENKDEQPEKKSFTLMFWKKGEKARVMPAGRVEEIMAAVVKYLPQIQEMLRTPAPVNQIQLGDNATTPQTGGSKIGKLYDFFADFGSTTANGQNFVTPDGMIAMGVMGGAVADGDASAATDSHPPPPQILPEQKTHAVTPKSVMHELEHFPTPELQKDLDKKINTLKDKSLMVNQYYAKQQIDALVKRLENRKKYADHEEFYRGFPNTHSVMIDALVKKYKLVIKQADLFIPTFPDDAVEVMKEYTRVTQKACGEDPVFYVIAEEQDFKEKYKKLDPILLVQSPFGFWWQVLGAWDKEILLLSEL